MLRWAAAAAAVCSLAAGPALSARVVRGRAAAPPAASVDWATVAAAQIGPAEAQAPESAAPETAGRRRGVAGSAQVEPVYGVTNGRRITALDWRRSYPFVVQIIISRQAQVDVPCTGLLSNSKQYVLSAKQCSANATGFSIVAAYEASPNASAPADLLSAHTDFDIMILKLRMTLAWPGVLPVKLTTTELPRRPEVAPNLKLVGFGLPGNCDGRLPNPPSTTDWKPVVQCPEGPGLVNLLCIQGSGSPVMWDGACDGDRGSPWMYWEGGVEGSVGIVAGIHFGQGRAGGADVTEFAVSVAYVKDWIQQNAPDFNWTA